MIKLKSLIFEEDFKLSIPYISHQYDYWNKKLFNNELPTLPFKIEHNKSRGGAVLYSVLLKTKGNRRKAIFKEFDHLAISDFFIHTQERFLGILVHEMIHVFLLKNNIVYTTGGDRMHGREFMEKLKELQPKVDFKIPVSENTEDLQLNADKLKEKIINVLLMKQKDKNYIALISNTKPLNKEQIAIRFNTYLTISKDELLWFKSKDKNLQVFSMIRDLGAKAKFYEIKDEFKQELLKTAADIQKIEPFKWKQ